MPEILISRQIAQVNPVRLRLRTRIFEFTAIYTPIHDGQYLYLRHTMKIFNLGTSPYEVRIIVAVHRALILRCPARRHSRINSAQQADLQVFYRILHASGLKNLCFYC
jgi:hypothetical protein